MSSTETAENALFLILPGQCVPISELSKWRGCHFLLSEHSYTILTERHHKLKLVLMLSALRAYAKALRAGGFSVTYYALDDPSAGSLEQQLAHVRSREGASHLFHFEIEDRGCADEVRKSVSEAELLITTLQSPLFLCSRARFSEYVSGEAKPRMANFYRQERRRLGLLLESDGSPVGGQWSFDADNRRALPKTIDPPPVRFVAPDEDTQQVIRLVSERFSDYPGDAATFAYPVTHRQANEWLDRFVEERLYLFGDYEDALTQRSDAVFHSLLSPLINIGLLCPQTVIERVLSAHQKKPVPMNSLEGFIRQVIGWREFIRGIYHEYGEEQETSNFFGHSSGLTAAWYDGSTGIAPLDHVIQKSRSLGWAHHIERLMVVGNLMNLCRIRPQAAHDWFMEMYVDSARWVMGPNVYGMALFSDGGIFATKPYLCGSSYIRKMGDYGKGEWCDVVDGLYWLFVHDHREYLSKNQRTAMMPRNLDRLASERKERIFNAANLFLEEKTVRSGSSRTETAG